LADKCRRVHVLVRANGLADSMSRYLIRRIEDNPVIELRTQTEIVALEGNGRLERIRWRAGGSSTVETRDIRHVFMMTGAVPNTGWLKGCLALDDKGFIKTGPDLLREDLAAANWPLTRPPFLLETSRPGVFAVGDVRGGNVKRVASAVGEGSIAVAFVHQVLQTNGQIGGHMAKRTTDADALASTAIAAYRRNRERSRSLFDLVTEDAYYSRPITLRQPLVFYEGHLPAFSFNTLIKRALGRPGIDARLEQLFARGIDPAEESYSPDTA